MLSCLRDQLATCKQTLGTSVSSGLPGKGLFCLSGFPNDPGLKKKWIVAVRRDQGKKFQITKHTKVCSKHFADSDFFSNYASGRRRLKEHAVQSVFNFPSQRPKVQRPPPKQRCATNVQQLTTQRQGAFTGNGNFDGMCAQDVDLPSSDEPSNEDTEMSSLERQSSVSSQGCPFCNEAKTAATQNQQLLKAAQDDLKATQNELLRVKMEL